MRRALPAVVLALLMSAPAEASVVAREGDFELRATERGDRLCMELTRDGRYRGEACGRIPRSPHRPLHMFPDIGFYNYVAAVPPSVHTAEVEDRSGRRVLHRTFAARGFSARFVLIPAPPAAVFVRFYGADGTLLGVDGGQAGYISWENETQVFGERGGGVYTHTEPLLSPTPDDAGNLRMIACVFAETSSGGNGFCDWRAANGFVLLSECGDRDVAGALLAPGVAELRLTLGSGAQLTLPAGELPAAFGGRRASGLALTRGEAVRDAAALDAAGQIIGRTPVGTAPGGQPCAGEDQGGDGFGGPLVPVSAPAGAVTVAAAGGESLLAADQGERLCVGLGRLRARVCPLPPADSDRPRLLRRGRAVAGVLSRDAARITLRLDRGDDVTVETTAGEAYTGNWAGDVRFFAATVPARREVTGAVVRNAEGTIIGISKRGIVRREVRRRVLAERRGRGVQLVRRTGRQSCLTAFAADLPPAPRFCTDLNPGTPIDGPFLPYSGAVTVPCAPRLAVAYGRMPDRFATPNVRLAGGRSVRSRRIKLRGEDAWVAFLPDARVRGLRAGDRRVALDLPPASAQCGYSADRAF